MVLAGLLAACGSNAAPVPAASTAAPASPSGAAASAAASKPAASGPAASGSAAAGAAPSGLSGASAAASKPAATGASGAGSSGASAGASAAAASGTAGASAAAASGTAGASGASPAGSGAAAAAPGVTRPAPLSPAVSVKVIDTGNSSQVPLYVAADRGYFKDEGLEVELVHQTDVSTAVQMVATNQVAFQASNPDPVVFNALDRGIDIKLLASSTVNTQNDRPAVFMVRQDLIDSGKYKTPADLKGLNIGSVGVFSLFYIDKVVAQGNLTLDDVKTTQLSPPDELTAFKNKGIDAAWVTEPIATSVQAQGLAKTITTTGALQPGAVAAELIMSPQFGQSQNEAAKRFVVAFVRGARDYYHAINKGDGDKGPVIQAMINHTAVKDPSLYSKIGLPSINPNANVDPTASWGQVQDFYLRRNIQQHKIDLSKYLDPSYINAALDRLGREPSP